MKKLIIIFSVFVLMWGGWFVSYPYFMRWLEGFSFFSTLPDFTGLHFQLPYDFFRYVGSFLLQFFAYPAAGAAIQALFPILTALCIWVVIKRIFKDSDRLFWISFIIVPVVVNSQLDDLTLVKTIQILVLSAAVALVVFIVTSFKRPCVRLPDFLGKAWMSYVVPAVSICVALVVLQTGPLSTQHESIARLTYMGEHKDWDGILKSVSRQDALSNEYKRKYVLLALSETGNLPDYAFRYGLKSSNDFLFHNPDGPLALKFNILFYRALGLQNAVVYYAYQQSLQSLPGLSYDAMRTLTDAYIELKDYRLAKKYMDILEHSTCNDGWLEERRMKLYSIMETSPDYHLSGEQFVLEDFYRDMSALIARYPENRKYVDYILCGLLADKNGNMFLNVMNMVKKYHYADSSMPSLYQEALCLVATYEPKVLEIFNLDERIMARFTDFTRMMNSGKASQAKRKYADTYWAYVY